MNEKGKEAKVALSMQEWIKKVNALNIISNLINLFILVLVYYVLVGKGNTHNLLITNFGFIILYITYISLIVPYNAIKDSQIAFIKGKWELKDSDSVNENEKLKSPWRRLTPEAIILSIGTLSVLWLVLWLTNPELLNNVIAIIIAFVITFILNTVLIKHHLKKDLDSFVTTLKSLKSSTNSPSTYTKHFFWQYIIPWTIILLTLNLIINLKSYTETVIANGSIYFIDLSIGIYLASLVILLWMWSVGNKHVLIDLFLVRTNKEKSISLKLLIISLVAIPLVVGVLVFIVLFIMERFNLTVTEALLITLLVDVISGILGLILGVNFGKREGYLNKIKVPMS